MLSQIEREKANPTVARARLLESTPNTLDYRKFPDCSS
jgi:hypothetical protein